MMLFDEIPLIDNHLHPPLPQTVADGRPFAGFFTETHDGTVIVRHVPHSRFYRRALRDLADLLGCGADERDVLVARAALGPAELLRLCVEHGNVAGLVVDDGYPAGGEAMAPAQMAEAGGCRGVRVLRLETLVGELATRHDSLASFTIALTQALEAAREGGAVALKSIAAYRCGLDFFEPATHEAAAALRELHGRAASGDTRVTDPKLIFYALATALEWAGETGTPVQLHTGFGDRDLDLLKANPALLRPLLEDSRFNRCPLVLLHASYPYCREAGYLAAMYANVYVDWSLANPLLAGPELVRVLHELLALAPATKLLYGSDAWGIPDWIALGARYGREALATVLADDPDVAHFARRILHDNAAELYGMA
ncbi:MAG: amidohydrolase family protein [Dehalococcoidia bacterium]